MKNIAFLVVVVVVVVVVVAAVLGRVDVCGQHDDKDTRATYWYLRLWSLYAYRRLCFEDLRQEQSDVTASLEYTPGPSMHSVVQHYYHH